MLRSGTTFLNEDPPLANYWLNLKNCQVLEIGVVRLFWPLTTTGAGETGVHTGEIKFVVDCRVNPVERADHDRIIVGRESVIVSSGGGNEMLKIVPEPELPPHRVAP